MRRLLLLVPLVLLVTAPPAFGGGFATVGLSSTPAGTAPGQPWDVDITVLQHGRTPLEGVTPVVRISSGGTTKNFPAKPTGKAGVYRASVVFPTAGKWTYEIDDGFIHETPHTFPAVVIGGGAGSPAAPPPPRDDGGIASGWLWGAGAALVIALAVLGFDRRRRLPGAPKPA